MSDWGKRRAAFTTRWIQNSLSSGNVSGQTIDKQESTILEERLDKTVRVRVCVSWRWATTRVPPPPNNTASRYSDNKRLLSCYRHKLALLSVLCQLALALHNSPPCRYVGSDRRSTHLLPTSRNREREDTRMEPSLQGRFQCGRRIYRNINNSEDRNGTTCIIDIIGLDNVGLGGR
ncbi:hypothetical protein J6590_068455 [Homalodisca vitripennis]|nr:hypothetical protein J6590_068455 [Homalodisca vitripennis]